MKKKILIILILTAQIAVAQEKHQPVIIDKMEKAGNYNIEFHASHDIITIYLLDSIGHQLPNTAAEGMIVLWLDDSKQSDTYLLKPKGEFSFVVKTNNVSRLETCEVILTVNKKKIRVVFKN